MRGYVIEFLNVQMKMEGRRRAIQRAQVRLKPNGSGLFWS
jgi:hypothetical protein